MKKAYIIGAGPSGLIAAHELLKKGVHVEIFEQSSMIGGMCRTWKEEDFLLDTGPHIYHTPDRELEAYWKELFKDLLIEGDFWSKNTVNGKIDELVDYPLSWESIQNFKEPLRSQILEELKSRDQEKSIGATNFDEYVENLVGRTLTDMFFKKYPFKVWGKSTMELTADWAPKRIEIREKITPFYTGQYAAVGKYGTGCIYEKIAEEINELGGVIHLESRVNRLKYNSGRITGFFIGESSVNVDLDEVLISTMPITILGKALGVDSNLSFRGIASVYIGVEEEYINWPDNIHWLYFDHDEYLFNRITNSTKLAPNVSLEGRALLTIESTYSLDDELDNLSSKELQQRVLNDVIKSGLLKSNFPKSIFVSSNKEPYVYPIQNKEYQKDLARINAAIGKYANLYSIGTGGDFNYADSQVLFYKAFDLVDDLIKKESSVNQIKKSINSFQFNSVVKINDDLIGRGYPAMIIGEIGLNHNGNISLAFKLIDEAVACGLKYVKLQKYKSGNARVSEKVRAGNYVEKITDQEETLTQMFDKVRLSSKQEQEVFKYARDRGLVIFSTPFDIDSAHELNNEFDVDCFKIASVDLVNLPLISEVARFGKPIILSCGMASLGDIEEAINVVAKEENPNLILLHCNSSYPAPIEDMNLKVIQTLERAFNVPIGLSDHTMGLLASTISLSIGASVIERHFTLDRFMDGPDHILSSEPAEMSELVQISKDVFIALGDGVKRVQAAEYLNRSLQRKCLYFKRDMQQGEVILETDLDIKGPGGGVLPKYREIVVGRMVVKDVNKDYPVTWDLI